MNTVKSSKKKSKELIKNSRTIRKEILKLYTTACHEGRGELADVYNEVMKHLGMVEQEISLPRDGTQSIRLGQPRYLISAKLIHDLFNYLVEEEEIEKMCQCTGVIDKATNTIIPTEILTPEMSERSSIFVKGDQHSINNILTALDNYSHSIVLQCHRHPGSGSSSTQPSSIDIRNHKDMETCYPVIGIIFVKDGYFRFFSAGREFDVEIYGTINGKEVVKVDDRTYRIPHGF